MKTFILLTFGFLGFALYEMSGGAEFEAASARLAEDIPETAPEMTEEMVIATAPQEAEPEATATVPKIEPTPDVTRVALDLTEVSDTASPATAPQDANTGARIIDSTETPQIILLSLIATTNNDIVTNSSDIRSVSGNRVNVRGGPSTNYGVVSSLTRGTEVRVLEDNGNGWVRMEPIEGGETGWMADFLLTSG
jgi:hypothetical protein